MESKFLKTTAKDSTAEKQGIFAVVVVAAGSGSRLGFGYPKAKVKVADKELLRWALEGVTAWGRAARIVVTVPENDTLLREIAEEFGALAVTGGATRAQSVVAALNSLSQAPTQEGKPHQEPDAVLVHDCARCFTPSEVFDEVAAALEAGGRAVIPVVPVVDTIKSVNTQDYVTGTPTRSDLRAVQTPQGFDLAELLSAYRAAEDQGLAESITDDAMLAETMGIPVRCVSGSAESFKITTPLDLALARSLYEKDET